MKPEIREGYYISGSLMSEIYYLNDKYHREDGPAITYYWSNGDIQSITYCINGKYHREDGPAFIFYYSNGNIMYENYFLNDIELTKTQWLIHCRKRKLKTL